MLELLNVRAGYGAINVLWDVSLTMAEGQADHHHRPEWRRQDHPAARHHGPGAGDARASITLDGAAHRRHADLAMADASVAMIPEGRMTFRDMSVEENLIMGAFPKAHRSAHAGAPGRGLMPCSRACTSGASSWPDRCLAARRRCWRWRAA
jgi:branched-chain amino acid transport system ATP-binding protein